MPLDRAHITVASRIMVPANAIFAGLLGACWVLQDPSRTNVPALGYVRDIWPIQATGVFLLALSGAVFVGMVTKLRAVAAIALGYGVIFYLALAVGTAVSLHPVLQWWPPSISLAPNVSISAPFWALYLATSHLASLISLALDEATVDGRNVRGPV